MNYTVDYFIEKFEAIPEAKFSKGSFVARTGEKCVLGWCGESENVRSEEGTFLSDLLMTHLPASIKEDIFIEYREDKNIWGPIYINDLRYKDLNNTNSTPRQRILAALYDIKQMQQPDIKPEPIDPPKPKREKIKVQIAPDLIEPPIPKEVEMVDRINPGPDEVIPLEEAAKDFQESLNDYSKALHSTIDFLMESAYQGYKKARTGNHFLTPEFYEGIYKREDIEKFEARLLKEHNGPVEGQ